MFGQCAQGVAVCGDQDAFAAQKQIAGQKLVVTKARKAIAGFKIREG